MNSAGTTGTAYVSASRDQRNGRMNGVSASDDERRREHLGQPERAALGELEHPDPAVRRPRVAQDRLRLLSG
jgi:hypothetical protein